MLISLPRIARSRRLERLSSSVPSKRIEPAILPGGWGMRPRMEFAVTDLPQPLSPTIARVSRCSTQNDTPSTARATPSRVPKWVCKFSISSSAIGSWPLGQAWVERIAQPVAEQIDREHRDRQERRRKEDDKGFYLPQGAALRHDVAP